MTVEEQNLALEERLSLLKRERDKHQVRMAVNELNDVIYSAIDLHAPRVNAVQIQTRADVSSECSDLPDGGYRARLKDYIQKATNQEGLEGIVPFLFNLHLPFAFTTGTHGSGERVAMSSSIRNVLFEEVGFGRYAPSSLKIDLSGGGWLLRKDVYFLPSEVDSVKLVQDSEFSPIYQDRDKPLVQPYSTLDHYLTFRGFRVDKADEKDIKKHKSEILPIMREGVVLIPEHSTGLLHIEMYDYPNPVMSGFSAVAFKKDGELEVYEFHNECLPKNLVRKWASGEEAAYVAYAAARHRVNSRPSIQVYRGNEAIQRLQEVRTERRFW